MGKRKPLTSQFVLGCWFTVVKFPSVNSGNQEGVACSVYCVYGCVFIIWSYPLGLVFLNFVFITYAMFFMVEKLAYFTVSSAVT